jgi:adenylate cyclase
MDERGYNDLAVWLNEAGLTGEGEIDLVAGFCERLNSGGVPIQRCFVGIDTLHPVHEGRAVVWKRGSNETKLTEYGRTGSDEGERSEAWRRSPFYHLLQTQQSFLRRRLTTETESEFSIFPELRQAGATDYMAIATSFGSERKITIMDGIMSSWTTDAPTGFRDEHIALLRRAMRPLAISLKAAALTHVAETLVQTYLGRDAGRRVLNGQIARGVPDRVQTVLWFSDLRGFTKIADTAPPDQIIPLLNDYAETIIGAIHEQGGDVLKLMGDGVLAIFTDDDRGRACRAALAAAEAARQGIIVLNRRRAASVLPITEMYLGLHVGEVFYGNVGSANRLDFTVVGPAVNEVSRIASLCRSVDQSLLLSSAFAAALGGDGVRLASVGRFALRGVGQAQDLFTLDRGRAADGS